MPASPRISLPNRRVRGSRIDGFGASRKLKRVALPVHGSKSSLWKGLQNRLGFMDFQSYFGHAWSLQGQRSQGQTACWEACSIWPLPLAWAALEAPARPEGCHGCPQMEKTRPCCPFLWRRAVVGTGAPGSQYLGRGCAWKLFLMFSRQDSHRKAPHRQDLPKLKARAEREERCRKEHVLIPLLGQGACKFNQTPKIPVQKILEKWA